MRKLVIDVVVPDWVSNGTATDAALDGIKSAIVREWRKEHGSQAWPPSVEFDGVSVCLSHNNTVR